MKTSERLAALRSLMRTHRLHAYLVPSTDPHQSEYVPALWRRREWLSGFTGSAGDVVVTDKKAALWTDGRYWLQAEAQLAGSGVALMKLGLPGTPSITGWLAKQLKKRQRVGVDPRVLSYVQYKRTRLDLEEFGIELVPLEENLVDTLWPDRPPMPDEPIEVYPVKYAGERFQDKLRRLRRAMADSGTQAHVVTALDAIAWLFNIRGQDVLHNPVVIAYAIITDKAATLYTLPEKVTPELRRAFGAAVDIKPYRSFGTGVAALGRSRQAVWVDPNTTSQWIVGLLAVKSRVMLKESPIALMKAQKNSTEIRGMVRAHVRDGVAMVRFLSWLEGAVGNEELTEISVAERLEEFRSRSRLFRGVSFDSIVGYAAHGAIIHYSATPATDVQIKRRGLLLVDSGGQYLDGTTDITRTIALGSPSPVQREQFTRVLRGHMAIAMAAFPQGTAGRQLDTLARKALWDAGYDYQHGTGHGVGAYLSVHEGPQSISHARDTGVALMPGMVCSNEPGCYEAGSHGIRTENLVYVAPDPVHSRNGRQWLKFENLTLCPIDLRLVDARLLAPEEIRYLNAYHAEVRNTLSRFLNKQEAAWLAQATRPIR